MGPIKVMLVDDHAVVRMGFKLLLAACDDIDLDACSRAGVMVTNTPDLGTGVEAEQRMMLIAADNLVAAFGFGRIGGIPANLVNHDVRCLLGCCP